MNYNILPGMRLGDGFPQYFQKYENELKKIKDEAFKRIVKKAFALDFIRMKEAEALEVAGLCGMGEAEVINCTKKYVNQIETIAPPEPAPEALPVQSAAAVPQTDPEKTTLKWLHDKKRQYITKYTESEKAVVNNGVMEFREPAKSEWRITKAAAFIYRALCEAAENGEILFAESAIADFMKNHLKMNDGTDITQDALTKADKRRQNPTK